MSFIQYILKLLFTLASIFPNRMDAGRYRGGIEFSSIGGKSSNNLGALSFRTTFAHNWRF